MSGGSGRGARFRVGSWDQAEQKLLLSKAVGVMPQESAFWVTSAFVLVDKSLD